MQDTTKADALRLAKGIQLTTKRNLVASWEKCFTGIEVIDWFLKNGTLEPEANEICRKLLESGMMTRFGGKKEFKVKETAWYRMSIPDFSCESCGAPGLYRCSDCKSARYCSKPCQEKEWNAHQYACRGDGSSPPGPGGPGSVAGAGAGAGPIVPASPATKPEGLTRGMSFRDSVMQKITTPKMPSSTFKLPVMSPTKPKLSVPAGEFRLSFSATNLVSPQSLAGSSNVGVCVAARLSTIQDEIHPRTEWLNLSLLDYEHNSKLDEDLFNLEWKLPILFRYRPGKGSTISFKMYAVDPSAPGDLSESRVFGSTEELPVDLFLAQMAGGDGVSFGVDHIHIAHANGNFKQRLASARSQLLIKATKENSKYDLALQDGGEMRRIELKLKRIPQVARLNTINPVVVVSLRAASSVQTWVERTRTEWFHDQNNPNYQTIIQLKHFPKEGQMVRFDVYNADLDNPAIIPLPPTSFSSTLTTPSAPSPSQQLQQSPALTSAATIPLERPFGVLIGTVAFSLDQLVKTSPLAHSYLVDVPLTSYTKPSWFHLHYCRPVMVLRVLPDPVVVPLDVALTKKQKEAKEKEKEKESKLLGSANSSVNLTSSPSSESHGEIARRLDVSTLDLSPPKLARHPEPELDTAVPGEDWRIQISLTSLSGFSTNLPVVSAFQRLDREQGQWLFVGQTEPGTDADEFKFDRPIVVRAFERHVNEIKFVVECVDGKKNVILRENQGGETSVVVPMIDLMGRTITLPLPITEGSASPLTHPTASGKITLKGVAKLDTSLEQRQLAALRDSETPMVSALPWPKIQPLSNSRTPPVVARLLEDEQDLASGVAAVEATIPDHPVEEQKQGQQEQQVQQPEPVVTGQEQKEVQLEQADEQAEGQAEAQAGGQADDPEDSAPAPPELVAIVDDPGVEY